MPPEINEMSDAEKQRAVSYLINLLEVVIGQQLQTFTMQACFVSFPCQERVFKELGRPGINVLMSY